MPAEGTIRISTWALSVGAVAVNSPQASTTLKRSLTNPRINPASRRIGLRRMYTTTSTAQIYTLSLHDALPISGFFTTFDSLASLPSAQQVILKSRLVD